MKTVITYGTFDLLHYGHIELLRRAKEHTDGGKLIVGISTDSFNEQKGKSSYMPFEQRRLLVSAIRYVDEIIPEVDWDQKRTDIAKHNVDTLIMGDDWCGKFDSLSDMCKVLYFPRTPVISSTAIKQLIKED